MAKPLQQLSFDSQRALEQFSSAFDAAFEASDPASEWAKAFGLVEESQALLLTYPMSISAAGYKRRSGDDAARDMYERSISITPEEWIDGVKVQKRRLEQSDFAVQSWLRKATALAKEAKRHANILAARVLHTNANLQLYKDSTLGTDAGIPLFSAAHQVNIFDGGLGTFKNVLLGGGTDFVGGTIDNAMFAAALNHGLTGIKGANGQLMAVNYTDLIVHPKWAQLAKDFLKSDLMRADFLAGNGNTNLVSNNTYKGIVNLTVADELAQINGVDPDKIYFVDRNLEAKPFIVQDGGTPTEQIFDGDSEFCKQTGMVKATYALLMGVTGALPHGILRVDLTP